MDLADSKREVDVDKRPNAAEIPGYPREMEVFPGRHRFALLEECALSCRLKTLCDQAIDSLLVDVEHAIDCDNTRFRIDDGLTETGNVGAVLNLHVVLDHLGDRDHRVARIRGIP